MSFSRYDDLDSASSRPTPEPEVRHAILSKWSPAERGRRRETRTCSATSPGGLQ